MAEARRCEIWLMAHASLLASFNVHGCVILISSRNASSCKVEPTEPPALLKPDGGDEV